MTAYQKSVLTWWAVTALVSLVLTVFAIPGLFQPLSGWCDGSLPVWMLEAQDYDGGGCAYELPPWQAPPDADWRMYCMGLCVTDNPADVSFPARDEDP